MRASLVVLAVTAGISTFSATSAFAYRYARHEHPIIDNMSFSGMTQEQADRLCIDIVRRTLAVGRVMALNRTLLSDHKVWHVWAHRENRECIANQ